MNKEKLKSNKKILALISLTLILFFGLFISNKAQAVTETPETASAAAQELRDKVKEIVREQIVETQKGQKMAFSGEITAIANANLKIETNQGEKTLKVATDAAIISKAGKKMKIGELIKGVFAIAMGYAEDNDILGVKRLVLIEEPKPINKDAAFGKVTDISSVEKVLTIKNEKQNLTYTVEIDDKTLINKNVNGKIQKIKFEAISKNEKIIAIGAPSENEHKIITAKMVYIIEENSPAPTEGKTPTSTPSAKTTP
jgi:hypothetical protein